VYSETCEIRTPSEQKIESVQRGLAKIEGVPNYPDFLNCDDYCIL
jgi:hypothetical protein